MLWLDFNTLSINMNELHKNSLKRKQYLLLISVNVLANSAVIAW